MTVLRLKKRTERRIEEGHGWVFSNEVDTSATPLKSIEPGAPGQLETANGKFLGHVYINPHSLIVARIVSRQKNKPFDTQLLKLRLDAALALREQLYDEPYYRLCHSEGDGLPGLTVDRFDKILVVQISTAGMEAFRLEIIQVLAELNGVESILLRNDVSVRKLERLPLYREWAVGQEADILCIKENNLHYQVPAEISQKTGWFYDHRDSRISIKNWVKDKQVLDVYSYLGAFGLNAALGGASSVTAVDASQAAVDAANANASLNQLDRVFNAECADAVEYMRQAFERNEKYDVVILDPPAFIKKRKDLEAGTRHYGLNNRLAVRLLKPGGILLSASCSQLLSHESLVKQVSASTPKGSNGVQLLTQLRQGADHPIHASMVETYYLKGVIARLL